MSLTKFLAPYADATLAELRRVVPALETKPGFYGQIHYHLGWATETFEPREGEGGKRIRPAFCLMLCELYAGDYTRALPAAAAVELLHAFSLVHDDIEDGDETRHHRPTLWKIVGKPQAINAGDGLFALAQLALLQCAARGAAAEQVLRAQQRLNETALALCVGQYRDMSFEKRVTVAPDEYIEMVRGKTAALLAYSGEVGAMLGGADAEECARVYALGEAMGLAFQMRDDLLGIWGDPTITGKPVGADIRAKKKSLPVAYALHHYGEGSELQALYRGTFETEAQVFRARALIEGSRAREQAAALAADYEARALAILNGLQAPAERLEPLRAFAAALSQRHY